MAQRNWGGGGNEEKTFCGSELINEPEATWKTEGTLTVASPMLHVSLCSMFCQSKLAWGLGESGVQH